MTTSVTRGCFSAIVIFMEQNPEIWLSNRAKEEYLLLAKVAIFDDLIDLHHDGYCTFEEAMKQYHADVAQLVDEA